MQLTSQKYGKGRVRVLHVRRGADGIHAVHEIEAKVMLEGDFADTYLTGDNSKVVATDTIKNTVTVLAQSHLEESLEEFTLAVAKHFLKRHAQVARVTVEVAARPWDRYASPEGGNHPHMFTGRTSAVPFCLVDANREKLKLQAGIRRVLLLKSTQSAFIGYPKCEYTTLPETTDRVMATEMEATWTFTGEGGGYTAANEKILAALLATYANEFSPSLQNTLYLMAGAALAQVPAIADIYLAMPNKHYLPVNFQPFGLENKNEIFLPIDEPHGQIEALVSR